MPRLQEPSEESELTDLADNESEVEARPSRPRRKSQKLRDENNKVSASEAEPEASAANDDDSNSESSLSPIPESPPKKKKLGRPRKGSTSIQKVAEAYAPITPGDKASSATPTKLRRAGGGRGGGNKRKHPHEYCLTCANYGRACSGRREGYPGCAVCREPDRSKGEKLRECLWAEPEKGIFTYPQAKEILKIAQAEERAKQGKAPTKRQLPFLSEEQRKRFMSAADTVGLVESRPRATATAPPPVSRPLNVRPPPSVMRSRQLLSDIESHAILTNPSRAHEQDPDTIVLNGAACSPGLQSAPKLFVEEGSSDDRPYATVAYTSQPPQSTGTQPLTDATGRRIPYYDPNLQAYVLPAYPHSNLLPPHMQDRVANVSYMSVYDAYPFLPVVMPNVPTYQGPQTVLRRESGSSSITSLSRTPSTVASSSMHYPKSPSRPLDKSGTPTRRYSRRDSIASGVSGYEISLKMWKPPATNGTNDDPARDKKCDNVRKATEEPKEQRVNHTSSLSMAPSIQADPIEAEDQPQISRRGSLSPQYNTITDQAAILPTKYSTVPERKRKRGSKPASPKVVPTPAVPEETAIVTQSIENTAQPARNGLESSLSSAIAVGSEPIPSVGRFSRPSLAEKTTQQHPTAVPAEIPASATAAATEKGETPVVSSGWQAVNAVNTVKQSVAPACPKASPSRSRKKRRTATFDIQEDEGVKKV